MAGFGRVDEKRRSPGTGQSGRNLVADMPGLAHADHHYAAAAVENQLAGFLEVAINALQQGLDGLQFKTDGALGGLFQVGGLAHGVHD